jgi:hypothetical protein
VYHDAKKKERRGAVLLARYFFAAFLGFFASFFCLSLPFAI